ncbi:MAG: PRC-barrel domain-containing protein [Patescibacteria group bacterium]
MYFQKKRKNSLIGLSVYTESGYGLGVVSFVEKDENNGEFKKIYVRRRFLFIFFGKSLIIDKSQILRIENKKIIVSETSINIGSENIIYRTENV